MHLWACQYVFLTLLIKVQSTFALAALDAGVVVGIFQIPSLQIHISQSGYNGDTPSSNIYCHHHCTRSKLEIMKTSRGCYDAQLFRRCAGRIVMVSCCCVCPQFFLSALPPRGSINNKHFCNNFQQKQIITLSGIDNVVSCYLSKNHNLQQHEKSKNLQKKTVFFCAGRRASTIQG